ncbi:hypothetical protein XA68_11699 [Ophiocordyceps unilateralis]|uniref:Phenylacetaldoxime dehydratase n=1 Tax=Ophiocordyceps unilateralis TaxID=268505 RepID=A0A2A9PGC8_OPHUN|nr:hypothetical protein XA68_11699 [Ophiocordyceps unilateralis]
MRPALSWPSSEHSNPEESMVDEAFYLQLQSFLLADSPCAVEWASAADAEGFYNICLLAYWPSKALYDKWTLDSGFRTWWESIDSDTQSHGWFLEVVCCPMDRFENIFSHAEPSQGAATMRTHVSGPVKEHHYWGSMRDRLPAGQTDELRAEKTAAGPSKASGVPGQQNVAMIRSGQDWSEALAEERQIYFATMQPVLKAGMDFLRHQGDEVGCISCRFMDVIDPATLRADRDRTFGLAYFEDVASLEGWSKKHPTHKAICV